MKNLSHWTIALDQLADCLPDGVGYEDLVLECGVEDEDGECEIVAPDPNTQVTGLKFDNLNVGDGECEMFSLTVDTSVLLPECDLGTGDTLASTKGGKQDITRDNRPDPGYACIEGPANAVGCDLGFTTLGDVTLDELAMSAPVDGLSVSTIKLVNNSGQTIDVNTVDIADSAFLRVLPSTLPVFNVPDGSTVNIRVVFFCPATSPSGDQFVSDIDVGAEGADGEAINCSLPLIGTCSGGD